MPDSAGSWSAGADLLADPGALQTAIDRGLCEQLQMESFVTCVLYIVLDQYPCTPAEFVQPQGSRYQEIPTLPTELEEVQDEVRLVIAKLAKIEFNAAVVAMTHAFEGMDRLTHSPSLNASLRSLEQAMPKFDEAIVNIRRLAVTLDKNTSSERLPFSKERSMQID
jgi:paraquat-inducible protein B